MEDWLQRFESGKYNEAEIAKDKDILFEVNIRSAESVCENMTDDTKWKKET